MTKTNKSKMGYFTWLSNMSSGYRRFNIFLAKQNLNVSKNKFIPVVIAGISNFFENLTKLGAFFALALTITGFISLSITPAGWALLSGGFIVGAIGLAFYKIYNVIHDLDKLADQQDKISTLEKKLVKLTQSLVEYKFTKLANQDLAKKLGINISKLYKYNEVDLDKLLDEITTSNIVKPQHQKLSNKIDGVIGTGVKFLLSVGVFVTKKIHVYNIINSFIEFSKLAFNLAKRLYNNCNPVVQKIIELSSIAGLTLASIGGSLVAASHILGVSMASLGIISAFTAITGLTGGIAIGVFALIAFTVAAIFVVNKVFFIDPLNQFADDSKTKENELESKIANVCKAIRTIKVDITLLDTVIRSAKVDRSKKAVLSPVIPSAGSVAGERSTADAGRQISSAPGYSYKPLAMIKGR